MNTAAFSPSGGGPSPDALRNHLSERSKQDLDALRSELDMRLLALENALTSPDDCESLESLVLELARVAMDEAEASTRRAIFEAQTDAQAQADAALVASMVHYGQWTIPAIKGYLSGQGIAVRKV